MGGSIYDEVARGEGLTLTEAARRFPPYRGGHPTSTGCIKRWVQIGAKLPDGSRVKLEAVRCRGRLLTTASAIARFLEAQTSPAMPG